MKVINDSILNTSSCILFYMAICIQFVFIGILEFSFIGYDVPILRIIIGYIFLTFVPGFLIIKVLKINSLNNVKLILYSAGLSIFVLMFCGFLINNFYSYFGVTNPLSTRYVASTLLTITGILSIFIYLSDMNFRCAKINSINISFILNSPFLLFILLPLLAITAALIVTFYHNNTLILLLLVIISIIPFFVVYDIIPQKFYCILISSIALALLFHHTFVSSHIVGCDIHTEYFFQDLVVQNSKWDYSLYPGNVNAMLSVVMLCPIYSQILDLNSVWIFKFVYPSIFSFIVIGLFEIYSKLFGYKKAFLSTFFFISIFTFFTEMTALARQEIAEVFYVLLILIIVEEDITPYKKAFLSIIFMMSIPVSHYGLSYITIFIFMIGYFLYLFMKKRGILQGEKFSSNSILLLSSETSIRGPRVSILNGSFVCLFIVFTLMWYLYICTGPFYAITHIGSSFISSLNEFFVRDSTQSLTASSLGLDFFSVSDIGKVYRILHFILEMFIVLGFIRLIWKPRDLNLSPVFIALVMVNYLLLFMCIILPNFSSYLNVTRFYHICLFFLAPFVVIGYETFSVTFSKILNYFLERFVIKNISGGNKYILYLKNIKFGYLFLTILLSVYFLFNSGFILEVSNQPYIPGVVPGSISLFYGDVDGEYYNLQEVRAVNWISDVGSNHIIFGDMYSFLLLNECFYQKTYLFPVNETHFKENSYGYLRSWNIQKNEVLLSLNSKSKSLQRFSIKNIPCLKTINSKNRIYNNGGSYLYY